MRSEMATDANALSSELENGTIRSSTLIRTSASYWALTKPDVNFLVTVSAGIAFCLASALDSAHFRALTLFNVLLGTWLTAGGSSALNQYIERRFDARMRRTARRPLAAGKIEPKSALRFGLLMTLAGVSYLAITISALVSALALLASTTYLVLYTPLKRITPLCTLVGAFPGAIPPLIGWAAASGRLSLESWVLSSFQLLWQFPHFMAIAWMYRKDYARARYRVLPGRSARTRLMVWQTLLPSAIAVPVSMAPAFLGCAGWLYASEAFLLGCLFLCVGIKLAVLRTNCAARRLLLASIVYLPAVLVLLLLDRV
jgi:protoheme IX farnesyltransferase